MNIEVYPSHMDNSCTAPGHYLLYKSIKVDIPEQRWSQKVLNAPLLKPQRYTGESLSPLVLPSSMATEEMEIDGERKCMTSKRASEQNHMKECNDQTTMDLEVALILHENCNRNHNRIDSISFSFRTDEEQQPEAGEIQAELIPHSANTVIENEKSSCSNEEFITKTSMEQSNQIKCFKEKNNDIAFPLRQRRKEALMSSTVTSENPTTQSKFTKTLWTMNTEQESEFCATYAELPIFSFLSKCSKAVK